MAYQFNNNAVERRKKMLSVGGTLLGGAAGAVVGGPAGAMTGASIGGALGGAVGTLSDQNSDYGDKAGALVGAGLSVAKPLSGAATPETADGAITRKLQSIDAGNNEKSIYDALDALKSRPPEEQEMYKPTLMSAYQKARMGRV